MEARYKFNKYETGYSKIEESVQNNNNIILRTDKLKSIRLISNLNKDTESDKLKWKEKKNEDGGISYFTSHQITPQKKLMFLLKSKNEGSLTDNLLTCSLKKEDEEKKSSSSVILRICLRDYPSLIQLLKTLGKKYSGIDFNIENFKDYKESPFLNELIFGDDGPLFKCGDRVIAKNYNTPTSTSRNLSGEYGIIVSYMRNGGYLICFDNNIGGYEFEKNNVKHGHGICLMPAYIMLASDKDKIKKPSAETDNDLNNLVKDFILKGSEEGIRYGSDGPDFKCKDRILFNGNIGTIVAYNGMFYLVYFDEKINNDDIGNVFNNIPKGHGTWLSKGSFIKVGDANDFGENRLKKGDRVICRDYEAYDSKLIINGTGKIVHTQKNYYLVHFDQNVDGHSYPSFDIPNGYGYYVHPDSLKLLDNSYSPFINTIRFGENGINFNCGDRIYYRGYGKNLIYGERGLVVAYRRDTNRYLVCLDISRNGISVPEHGIPSGKGLFLTEDDMKKI